MTVGSTETVGLVDGNDVCRNKHVDVTGTSTIRRSVLEIVIEPDVANGLVEHSSAQCQHIRAVSAGRVQQSRGNVGSAIVSQIRDTIGLIFDVPK